MSCGYVVGGDSEFCTIPVRVSAPADAGGARIDGRDDADASGGRGGVGTRRLKQLIWRVLGNWELDCSVFENNEFAQEMEQMDLLDLENPPKSY